MNVNQKYCHIGWQITSRCNLKCPHCLRRNIAQSPYENDAETCAKILDSFFEFAMNTGRKAIVEFAGGNPMLREDLPDLLQKTCHGKQTGLVDYIRILGNPETLDNAAIELIKACAVDNFFISLDGLRAMNDQMRGQGNFDSAVAAIRNLAKAGIYVSVKITLIRENQPQLKDVIRLALDEGARSIGIGQLIIAGGGYAERDKALTPPEYRAHLLQLLEIIDGLPAQHREVGESFFRFNRNMFALLFHEMGCMDEFGKRCTHKQEFPWMQRDNVLFVVWQDGEVVLRRDFPRIGYVPQSSFQKIYDESPLIKVMEQREYIHALSQKSKYSHVVCRTCPVVEHCEHGLAGFFGAVPYFAPSHLCWKIYQEQSSGEKK